MAQKISKTQFENWSEQIKKLELESLKMVPEGPEKDKAFDFISTVIVEIKKGNTLALLIEALGVFQTNFTLNSLHVKSSVLDNLTAEEWTNDIIKQIEEHHKQRRNYSVNVNDILTRLEQQEEISKDKSRRDQIMSFLLQAEKVANQRKDFAFKEVKWLRDNYDFFGVENFKSSKIVEREKVKSKWYSPKKMYDSALSLFLKLLWDKVAETGQKVVKVNPAYTSQTCSRCNKRHPVKLEKSDRVFICAYCGLVLDRDVNSARNILYKAQMTEFGTNFVKQAHASP